MVISEDLPCKTWPFNRTWGRSGGGRTELAQVRNDLVVSPKEDDVNIVSMCAKVKCRWALVVGEGMGSIFSEDRSDSGCLEAAEGRPAGVGGRWRRPQGRAGPGRLGGSDSRSFSGHLDDGAGA